MNDFNPGQTHVLHGSDDDLSSAEKILGSFNGTEQESTDVVDEGQSLRRMLLGYEIGFKLKQLRLRKKIALVDLGRFTNLSASMLSQLENGKLIPTLPTLARISMVFDVGLDHFFADRRPLRMFSIVRNHRKASVANTTDRHGPGFCFEPLDFGVADTVLSAYLAEFPKDAHKEVREHVHEGSQFVHVITGVLGIRYQAEERLLSTGDSVYFDSAEAHSYFGHSDEPTRAIIVSVPPTRL